MQRSSYPQAAKLVGNAQGGASAVLGGLCLALAVAPAFASSAEPVAPTQVAAHELTAMPFHFFGLDIGTGVLAVGAILALGFLSLAWWRERSIARQRLLQLREAQHRFVNHIQVLISLTRGGRNETGVSGNDRGALIQRLRALALLNCHLSTALSRNNAMIPARPYLDELGRGLHIALGGENVQLTVTAPDEQLPAETLLPLALIINEAVANSFKYAFQEQAGRIDIVLEHARGVLELTIVDDGVGCRQSIRCGQGTEIIHELAEQIGARAECRSGPSGTLWRIANICCNSQDGGFRSKEFTEKIAAQGTMSGHRFETHGFALYPEDYVDDGRLIVR